MPRIRQKATPTRSAAENTIDWFKTVDADTSSCDQWDIKESLLGEAVLGLLAAGKGITFGRAWDGEQIVITVYDGEVKQRKYVSDSIEFDDAMGIIGQRLRAVKEKGEVVEIRAKAR